MHNLFHKISVGAGLFFACLHTGSSLYAQQNQKILSLSVIADKPAAKVSSSMWGIFFEDINFAADGGLYAELVKNRSFEFGEPKMGWKERGNGKLLIINRAELGVTDKRYVAVTVRDTFALINEGFRGIGIKAGTRYNFAANIRSVTPGVKVLIKLVNDGNEVIGQTLVGMSGRDDWHLIKASITATKTEQKACLQVVFIGEGTADIDMISLFPQDTWKGRLGGLRKDLVEKLAALKPGFIRFPGGCIVEGSTLDRRYQWKKTVGDVTSREVLVNRWNTEFPNRSSGDYYQSFGLGFYEYFLLAEDLGAKPLPILNCGMACQFNTAEVVGMDQLDPYIQDALDLVEFANGDSSSQWGKLRAAMGHPAPFGLDRIGIGNEQWDEQYLERYWSFESALKQRYPMIKLVAAAGPSPKGKEFDFAWKNLPHTKVDFIDEHYYQSPEWFFKNANRYDEYDRNGPKVFAGEYASHDRDGKLPESRNTWLSALSEAAFMTGLERNADVVQMAAYAPLFAHVEAWQWRPDLIWFDNLSSIATPNYYIQQLFSNHTGDYVVPILSDGKMLAGGPDSLYASATISKEKKKCIVKLVNASQSVADCQLKIIGMHLSGKGDQTSIHGPDRSSMNTIAQPTVISPVSCSFRTHSGPIRLKLQPNSVNVFELYNR